MLLGRVFCETPAVSCCWVVTAFVSTVMVSGSCVRPLGAPLGGIIRSGLSARSRVVSCRARMIVMVWYVGGFDGNGVHSLLWHRTIDWTELCEALPQPTLSCRVLIAAFWSSRRHSNVVSLGWSEFSTGRNSVRWPPDCFPTSAGPPGFNWLCVVGSNVLVRLPNSRCAGLVAIPSDGVLRMFRRPRYGSSLDALHFLSIRLAMLTAGSTAPLARLLPGLLVSRTSCQFWANFPNTANAYCGPLSPTKCVRYAVSTKIVLQLSYHYFGGCVW